MRCLIMFMLLVGCASTVIKEDSNTFIVKKKRSVYGPKDLCEYVVHAKDIDYYFVMTSKCFKYNVGDTLNKE